MNPPSAPPDESLVSLAAVGWRVAYFLRRSPWIREVPIAAFAYDGGVGQPMVLGRSGLFAVKVPTDVSYHILAPGDSGAWLLARARKEAEQHRRWLHATREERAKQKEADAYLRRLHEMTALFEKTESRTPASRSSSRSPRTRSRRTSPASDPKGRQGDAVDAIRDEVRERVAALLARRGWAS